jgi:hypothetical protein
MTPLVVVAVALVAGWMLVGWMLWENTRRQDALAKTLEDLDSQS